MRRSRRPRAPRAPKVRTGRGGWATTTGMVGGGELREAALVIAKDAYSRTSQWSQSVPASLAVEGDDQVQTVSFDAPAAYPAEVRSRHPLFGNRKHWYGPPGKPFLRPAADAQADPAMAKYAKVIDRIAREKGWTLG